MMRGLLLLNEDQGLMYLKDVWSMFDPNVDEKDLIGKFVGAIYIDLKGKPNLFVGKTNRRFLEDKNGPVHSLELDCLKPAIEKTTILEEIPDHLDRDIGLFPIYDVISGPMKVLKRKDGKWCIPGGRE